MGRRYNTAWKRWEHLRAYEHDGQAWIEVMRGDQDNAAVLSSAFLPETYMGRGTVLQRDISQMPVHPDSDAMARFMWDWSPFGPAGGWGDRTALNTSARGTQPIHMYVVDSTHPDCNFREFGGGTLSVGASKWEVDTYMKGMIPLPSWAVPAQNHDRGMAVYDVGTGIMREYFMTLPVAEGSEVWAGGGGYSIGNPGLRDLATTNYALQQRTGLSNVTGMHNSLGFVGITEALDKKINHALCFTMGAAWGINKTYPELLAEKQEIETAGGALPSNWPSQDRHGTRVSWPARAADGKAERYIPENTWKNNTGYTSSTPHLTPTHGQWGRLKADVDPMYDPRTKLPYRPFTRVLIEAAKEYGLVPTDTNLWVNAFNAEQGRSWAHQYGTDPWATGGAVQQVYATANDPSGYSGLDVRDFPWDRTEWADLNWGQPTPDWGIFGHGDMPKNYPL